MIPLRKSRSTSTRFVVVRVVVAVFYALGLHFMSCITCSQSIDLLFPFAAFLWLICFPGKFIWRSCSHGTKLSYLCGSAIPHGLIDKVIVFSSLFGGARDLGFQVWILSLPTQKCWKCKWDFVLIIYIHLSSRKML